MEATLPTKMKRYNRTATKEDSDKLIDLDLTFSTSNNWLVSPYVKFRTFTFGNLK